MFRFGEDSRKNIQRKRIMLGQKPGRLYFTSFGLILVQELGGGESVPRCKLIVGHMREDNN